MSLCQCIILPIKWNINALDWMYCSISWLFTPPFVQGADQRKHQSSASLAIVRVIHRWLVNSPHKGPVTRKLWWRHHEKQMENTGTENTPVSLPWARWASNGVSILSNLGYKMPYKVTVLYYKLLGILEINGKHRTCQSLNPSLWRLALISQKRLGPEMDTDIRSCGLSEYSQ